MKKLLLVLLVFILGVVAGYGYINLTPKYRLSQKHVLYTADSTAFYKGVQVWEYVNINTGEVETQLVFTTEASQVAISYDTPK